MNSSFFQAFGFLIIGVAVIILLTAKFRVHAFFALMIACFVVGLGMQMPPTDVIATMKDGFGSIMKSLGFIIVLGTTLGVLLEYTGSSKVMAEFILNIVGEKYAALGISMTGFIVGLPIFCDSGYIVLNGLNQSLAKRTGIPVIVMSVSLATGLLSVHCLIPPHPGASAAAATIGVDFGKLMIAGIIIAIPAMLVGYIWAIFAAKKFTHITSKEITEEKIIGASASVVKSFLPVIVPIILIAAKSFLGLEKNNSGWMANALFFLGDPVVALSAGVVLAFNCGSSWKHNAISKLLQEAGEKAGGILVIIGSGGAFGAVIAAGKIGEHFSHALPLGSLGLLFPFLLTMILKTAQGSSTVAIITASSIVLPLLPALGLQTENGKLLCVLSMGAGSMIISHANDAYFWVISKFSGIEMKPMLKVYSLATLFMGLVTMVMVYILSLFIH
ncbi:MAG: GntP family permease [Bacteroidetes bacterium]|nr:GntP family permease [Bacteroidota bacterium]